VRQKKIDYGHEAKKKSIIAVRRRKNLYPREAKKKSIIAMRQRKINIAVRRGLLSGG
jgi:hypothetical protein